MEAIQRICSCKTTFPRISSCKTTTPPITPPRHEANIRLNRNSAWIRLGIDKHDTPILLDTGAGLNLIRKDIVEFWLKHHADKMSIKEGGIAAETCDGSPLEITGKVTISPCHLSGGPPLTLTLYIAPNLFCEAILGLPEMTARELSIHLKDPPLIAKIDYKNLPGDPQPNRTPKTKCKILDPILDPILQKLTPTSQKLAPILNHELTIEPLEAVKIPCRGVIQGSFTTPHLSIPSSPLVIADLNKYYTVHCSVTYITVLNPTTRPATIRGEWFPQFLFVTGGCGIARF